MHKPHLPTFAATALSLPYPPIANPAIEGSYALPRLSPAPPSGMVGVRLPGGQGWQ